MLGTILNKPVPAEAFREAMAFCCDPANGARMMEYKDRYEVAEKPVEAPKRKAAPDDYAPEPDPVEALAARVDTLEKRLWALEAK